MPEVSDHMSDSERQRVRGDADAQRAAADAADQLQRQFEQGPDGLPLSPEATERLQPLRKPCNRPSARCNAASPTKPIARSSRLPSS